MLSGARPGPEERQCQRGAQVAWAELNKAVEDGAQHEDEARVSYSSATPAYHRNISRTVRLCARSSGYGYSWQVATTSRRSSVFGLGSGAEEEGAVFKYYSKVDSFRIEQAYQRGDSKVRLKAYVPDRQPLEVFFADMIEYNPSERTHKQVRRRGRQTLAMHLQRRVSEVLRQLETGRPRRETWVQYEQRRCRALARAQGLSALGQRGTTRTEGWAVETQVWSPEDASFGAVCAQIVQSGWFTLLSTVAVVLNGIWIGVDTDWNTSTSPYAGSGYEIFFIMDWAFLVVFSLELVVRCLACKRKADCLRNAWLRFDVVLVAMMFIETLLPLVVVLFSPEGSRVDLKGLSILRLLRLLRLSRIARALRAFPEVVTILKGIAAATRSVVVTLLLVVAVTYVFAIFFKTQLQGYDEISELYFSSVADSMWTLIVHGTILDSVGPVMNAMQSVGWVLPAAFLVYVLISCFTLMNMLVGILCQVVSQVSAHERAAAERSYLETNLLEILECYDRHDRSRLDRDQLDLVFRNPEVHDVLNKFGTDAQGLELLLDAQLTGQTDLGLRDILDTALRLGGGKSAHVKDDVVELREYVRLRCDDLERRLLTGRSSRRCSSCISASAVPPTSPRGAAAAAAGAPAARGSWHGAAGQMSPAGRRLSAPSQLSVGRSVFRLATTGHGSPRASSRAAASSDLEEVLEMVASIASEQQRLCEEVAEMQEQVREFKAQAAPAGPPAGSAAPP
ncbi:unnamed protein product [Prorocentrum cordatum]|uniref:Ion transport domain-containing protein n=1 Tax=Prorocentrum cordatum TaxID=2364126 RepID=A0ABN9SLA4_9DINO|nr:unnamed protein product [Polarella glacialis]